MKTMITTGKDQWERTRIFACIIDGICLLDDSEKATQYCWYYNWDQARFGNCMESPYH